MPSDVAHHRGSSSVANAVLFSRLLRTSRLVASTLVDRNATALCREFADRAIPFPEYLPASGNRLRGRDSSVSVGRSSRIACPRSSGDSVSTRIPGRKPKWYGDHHGRFRGHDAKPEVRPSLTNELGVVGLWSLHPWASRRIDDRSSHFD